MRQPETPLCTIYERGRVIGFVLDRGVAGFRNTTPTKGRLACSTPGTAPFQPCGNFGRTTAADPLLLHRHNSVANTGSEYRPGSFAGERLEVFGFKALDCHCRPQDERQP
jgi:hypothetical protein